MVVDFNILTTEICNQAIEFGFLDASIAQIKIDEQTQSNFLNWIKKNFHGDMSYLKKNMELRFTPELLHHGTLSIICVKAPYLHASIKTHIDRLNKSDKAYVSSYALGRDYHKILRKKLKQYAAWIQQYISQFELELNYRVFTDSAPVLEIELAKNAGLGFRGKNTLLLNKDQGSMFFLGEIFTNLPLIPGKAVSGHCGTCTKCLDVCPTQAFISPYLLDAKKCISYLTIENKGSIPVEFRAAIGNRIYGCDDCQLFCPWNKFSKVSGIEEFKPRNNLDNLSLVDAFLMDEETWEKIMQGSSIYRIGYECWLRNVAIALGNSPTSSEIINALKIRENFPSEMLQEHIKWALSQHKIN